MQLVMLAPASNLVTSVTAALMPTLLGPAASMTSNQTHTKSGNYNFSPKIEILRIEVTIITLIKSIQYLKF